ARPPGAGYRLRKFVRRNRGRVLAAAALAVSLLAGAAAVLAVETKAGRERAAEAADRAARAAGTAASVAEALREARERAGEAWTRSKRPSKRSPGRSGPAGSATPSSGCLRGGTPTKWLSWRRGRRCQSFPPTFAIACATFPRPTQWSAIGSGGWSAPAGTFAA